MTGLRQISQTVARGAGTTALECHPDPLPAGFGITHRWEAYAASAEPADTVNEVTLPHLKDLIGTADLTPNGMGASGATAPSYHMIDGQVGMGFGGTSRLMTALSRPAPHTLVALVRPRLAGYTELSTILGGAAGTQRASVYVTAAGNWALNSGTTLNGPTLKGGYWQVVTAVFNGASSVLRVDGVEVTGNAGSEVADRLVLGSYGPALTSPMAASIASVYYAPTAWSASQRADFETWVRTTNRLAP